jgi:hypothetical protein
MVVPLTRAAVEGIEEAIELAKLSMAEETVPESDSMECWTFSTWAELTAMMTAQFSMNVEHISCAEVVSSLECKSSSMAESFDHQPSKGAQATGGARLALSLIWRSPPSPKIET